MCGRSCRVIAVHILPRLPSTGTHNRFFPSRADAWMFRQYAYDYAGLTRAGVNSHDNHPPRKITIITRKRTNGRMFDNQDDLIAAANATGLEVEIVQDLGKLPFKKVRLTGEAYRIAAPDPCSALARSLNSWAGRAFSSQRTALPSSTPCFCLNTQSSLRSSPTS